MSWSSQFQGGISVWGRERIIFGHLWVRIGRVKGPLLSRSVLNIIFFFFLQFTLQYQTCIHTCTGFYLGIPVSYQYREYFSVFYFFTDTSSNNWHLPILVVLFWPKKVILRCSREYPMVSKEYLTPVWTPFWIFHASLLMTVWGLVSSWMVYMLCSSLMICEYLLALYTLYHIL